MFGDNLSLFVNSLAMSPTPLHVLVTVANSESPWAPGWALVAAMVAIVAAFLALRQIQLATQELGLAGKALKLAEDELKETRKQSLVATQQFEAYTDQMARRSALSVLVADGQLKERLVDGKFAYAVPLTIVNRGNRGLRDFRIEFSLSPGVEYLPRYLKSIFTFVDTSIAFEDGIRPSIQAVVGPIYAGDTLPVGDIGVVAMPGQYHVRCRIISEDGIVPKSGVPPQIPLRLPGPAQ